MGLSDSRCAPFVIHVNAHLRLHFTALTNRHVLSAITAVLLHLPIELHAQFPSFSAPFRLSFVPNFYTLNLLTSSVLCTIFIASVVSQVPRRGDVRKAEV
jgi:hypothetical protein